MGIGGCARLHVLPLLCQLLLLSACSRGEPAPTKSPAPVVVETKPEEPAPTEVTPSPPTTEHTQAIAAQQLLTAWVDAQNGGDFDAYSKLYADRFSGVKRAGSRVSRYDRARWMSDRRGMFRRPMHVEANDVQVRVSGPLVLVRFAQKWSSAKFADEGAKAMTLVPTEAGLRISSEAMLDSSVARRGSAPVDPDDFRFVIRTSRTYVVLSLDAPDEWLTGSPVLDTTRDSYTMAARRAVHTGSVPAMLLAASGQRVDLYGRDGRACQVTLGAVHGLRREIPHFCTVEARNGGGASGCSNDEPMTDREVAADVWKDGEVTLLVAEATRPDSACDGATWARPSARQAPSVFVPEDMDDDTATRLQAAFRVTPSYRSIAREYVREPGDPEHWEQNAPKLLLTGWRDGARMLYTVEAASDGCGSFLPPLTALFEAQDGQLRLLGEYPNGLSPNAIVDVNLDGLPDLQGTTWLAPRDSGNVIMLGASEDALTECPLPFHDCGC